MARQGVTQEQVFEAAQALLDEGQNVTVASIRERLNNTGSFSTINNHLSRWREANDNQKPADIPDMPGSVDNALRHVWALAWKEAQALIKIERDGLEVARREIEREKKDMEAEIARLEAQLDAQAEELKRVGDALIEETKALSEAKNALQTLDKENARLDERLNHAEQRHRDDVQRLEAIQQDMAAIRGENATLSDRLTQAGKEREAMVTVHSEKISGLERQRAEDKAALKSLEKELAASQKTGETAQKAKETAEMALQAQELENAKLTERAALTESRVGELREEIDKLHARLKEATEKTEKPPVRKKN